MASAVYVGIDVAKGWLDVAARPGADPWRVDNAPAVALVACMRKLLTILNAVVRSRTAWRTAPVPSQ
jgi:hypothetical protein